MEDILASIRRILNEDEPASPTPSPDTDAAAPPPRGSPAAAPPSEPDDVLVLDASMMVNQPPKPPEPMSQSIPPKPETPSPAPIVMAPAPAQPAPTPPPPPRPEPSRQEPSRQASPVLVAPEAAAGVASSLGNLVRTLSSERGTAVYREGPTIEDLVREEVRPLVKDWLDRHLPPLVERLVRAEIERVVGRAAL